ncbi:MAG TPA: hypothetical protein VMH81_14745 [Bryobacteraceae bacterium]|nr:hypothetical protein [Bryobacteraceae bacterium]
MTKLIEPLIGLATLARMAFAGADLTPVKALLLDRLARNQRDANAWMDLAIVLQLMGQREIGLAAQASALEIQRLYRLPCPADSAAVRLLGIVTPGDLSVNNALEFLVEETDVALDLLYVSPDLPPPSLFPEHDIAMVAVCESERNRSLLRHVESLVSSWPRPVICRPERIARLSRDRACRLLPSQPGLRVPLTDRVDRRALRDTAEASLPIIVRPVDSQKGQGLRKLDRPQDVADYLKTRPEEAFYAAPYLDYRGPDGLFRKYRIVLIDGRAYACHMAISHHWVVHYISAGMAESSAKRGEEAQFFARFDGDFAQRHRRALATIAGRLELEYVGIDCGETREGELLVFEVDSGMTVHSMDPAEIYPYKQPQMRKVFRAFRQMLVNAANRGVSPAASVPARAERLETP